MSAASTTPSPIPATGRPCSSFWSPGFVVTGLALIAEILYAPPYWLHAALWGPLAILLPLVLLRSFKGVLIALQFRHKAEEGKLASE